MTGEPMTNTCANCAHAEVDSSPRPGEWMRCGRSYSNGGEPDTNGTLMYASDEEEWSAWAMVLPAFGCVMWEARVD